MPQKRAKPANDNNQDEKEPPKKRGKVEKASEKSAASKSKTSAQKGKTSANKGKGSAGKDAKAPV